MDNQNRLTEKKLIAVIRADCLRQAQIAKANLDEVVACLGDENHLGALGSFAGLDEDIACLKVFLTRIARLTVGQTPNRSEQPARPEIQKGEKRNRAKNAKTRNSI